MKLSAQNLRHSCRHSCRSSERRGILTAWTIWIMLALGVIAGSVFNILWISGIHSQALNCAASAAVAAGHSYLSDDLLRVSQQSFEYDGRMARCQTAAVQMAEQYRVGTSLPAISPENITATWPDQQRPSADASLLVPKNITVSFDDHRGGPKVPLFFSGLTHLFSSRLGVHCGVALEHAPIAFQPGRGSVPLLPFTICDDAVVSKSGQGKGSGYWTEQIETGKGQDRYSWNNHVHQFEAGPDGLPEIIVTIYGTTSAGSPDAFIPVCFRASNGQQSSSGTHFPDWIQNGLTHDDLSSLGHQELSFPGTLPVATLTPLQLTSAAGALQKKIGEPCLICLSSVGQSTGTSVTLKRPVATRIVSVSHSASGSIKVTLQPCVLVTATAITAHEPNVALNRYVYSVRLSE